jgi:hypothetical protein
MTTVETVTAEQIRREGMQAVKERLGVAGAIRFLQQFDQPGHDYAAGRPAWADTLTQGQIVSGIEPTREESASDGVMDVMDVVAIPRWYNGAITQRGAREGHHHG